MLFGVYSIWLSRGATVFISQPKTKHDRTTVYTHDAKDHLYYIHNFFSLYSFNYIIVEKAIFASALLHFAMHYGPGV